MTRFECGCAPSFLTKALMERMSRSDLLMMASGIVLEWMLDKVVHFRWAPSQIWRARRPRRGRARGNTCWDYLSIGCCRDSACFLLRISCKCCAQRRFDRSLLVVHPLCSLFPLFKTTISFVRLLDSMYTSMAERSSVTMDDILIKPVTTRPAVIASLGLALASACCSQGMCHQSVVICLRERTMAMYR